jgi:hypothetical protein
LGTEMADGLILRGTTEDNTRILHRKKRYKNSLIPGYLENLPQFYDSSYLGIINNSCL